MRVCRTGLDHGKLIESDAPVPIRDARDKGGAKIDRARTPVEHDKVVAEAVHLHEGKSGVARIFHGDAYNVTFATNPYGRAEFDHFRG